MCINYFEYGVSEEYIFIIFIWLIGVMSACANCALVVVFQVAIIHPRVANCSMLCCDLVMTRVRNRDYVYNFQGSYTHLHKGRSIIYLSLKSQYDNNDFFIRYWNIFVVYLIFNHLYNVIIR